MKLMLQVMFLQGRLWRQRAPDVLEQMHAGQTSVWCIGAGVALVAVGLLRIGDSSAVGLSILFLGSALLLAYAEPILRIGRMSREWAVNTSWSAASIFLVLIPATLLIAAANSEWLALGYVLLIALTMGANLLLAIETKYLAFAGRPYTAEASGNMLTILRTATVTLPLIIILGRSQG